MPKSANQKYLIKYTVDIHIDKAAVSHIYLRTDNFLNYNIYSPSFSALSGEAWEDINIVNLTRIPLLYTFLHFRKEASMMFKLCNMPILSIYLRKELFLPNT